jgi:hypothetical protein
MLKQNYEVEFGYNVKQKPQMVTRKQLEKELIKLQQAVLKLQIFMENNTIESRSDAAID